MAAEIDAEETDATESMQAQELQEEESRPETIVEVPETTAPVTEETEPVEQDGSPETVIVPESCPPDSVKILQVPSVLSAGETCQLAVTVLPENAEYTLNWESSNSTVVTVSEDGMLTAVSGGTAKITVSIAEAELVFDTVEVKVTQSADPLTSLRSMLAEYAHIADVPDGQPLEDEGFFLCDVSAGAADAVTLQPGVHTPDGISVQYAWLKLNAEQTAFEPMAETATSVTVAVDEVEQYACLVSYQDTGAVVLFQISEDQLSTMEVETQSAVVISRADWVGAMVDTLGLSIAKSQYPDNYYSDITKDSSCYDDVMVATAYGLISVTEGTPFEPDASATRNFAAETAVFLVGFQSKGSVSFADEAQCANPTAAKVAVERGWISLFGGNFCPDQEITAAEKDAILADCLSARESTKVDSYYDSKFNFKENVFVFDPSVVAELVDDSTVKIYEPDATVQTGDLIAVYTWEIPTVFKVATVTKQEDCLLVTGQIQKLEDNVDSMDAEGSVTVDLLDVQPAEGVTATYIFTDQTQTQSLSYARTMVARGQKRIRDVVLNKTINLGTNINIQITGLLSDLVVDYRLNATPGNADVLVALSGKESVTVNGDVSVNWSDTLASLPIEGIGSLEITSSLKVEAGITSTTSGRFRVGVSYTSNDGLQAIREYVPESFTLDAETKGTMRVRAQLGLADWFPMISGYAYAEAGYTVEALRNTVSGRTPETCIELSSWTFVTIGYYASIYDPLDGIDETYKGSYPIYDKTNSPERVIFHYEDGVLVPECTVPGNDFSRYKTPSDSRFGSGSWNLGGNTGRRSNGETFQIFTYTLDKDENATITGYNGNASALSIPATIDGHPVVAIGSSAFSGRTGLQAVYIGNGVTDIGACAFEYCSKLQAVTLPKTLTDLGTWAFRDCVSLTEIEIPKSLQSVGSYGAFVGCTNLSSIIFEEGITTIPGYLFLNCPGITSIVIPDTVTSIGGSAFAGSALQKVVLSKNLTKINGSAFENTGISEVIIPEGVTDIGACAFEYCSKLQAVTLPKTLTNLGTYAFRDCVSLTEIEIPKSLQSVGSYGAFVGCTNLSSIIFEKGITSIPECLFRNCPGITSIVIPDTVTSIGGSAFADSALQKVVLSKNLTKIGGSAFENTDISEVIIPEGVTNIGAYAFEYCSKLQAVTLPKTLTDLGTRAFHNCEKLQSISLPDRLTTVPSETFRGCSALETVTLGNSVTKIDTSAFRSCIALREITIPNTVTTIGDSAFQNCDSLVKITIPDSVTSFGTYVFYDCDSLTDVTLSGNMTSIPQYTFGDCDILEEIVVPRRVTSIDGYAFTNAVKFHAITIPRSVTSIASTAFSYPQKLTIYGVAGTYAETFANEKSITFVDKQVNAESVSLNTSEISLAKGASQTLVLSVSPVDCTDAVSWKSSNTSVATISDTGALKAVGLGTATIKVVVGSKSASCKVTVYQPVTSISLNRSSLSMGALDTFQLTATVSPSTAVNKDVTWFSSAPEIASVTDNGLVTALGKGKATITVKAADGSGVSRSCSVTVTNSAYIAATVSELESAHPYGNNCTDVWVYTIQNAKQLKVTFDPQTEMEDGFDYLLIQDGTRNLVLKATGTELAGQSITVPGDTLRIQMQSDDSGNAWGFKVTDVQSVKPDCKHVSDAGTVTKEPACETAGTKTFTCTKCGETLREETIPPLGHNEKVTKAGTAATCTQSGLTEEKTCTRCGKITQAQAVIPALEHDWGETVYQWTEDHSGCTAHRTCKRDNTHTESAEAQVSTTTQEATCSEPGKQEFIAVFDEVWAEKTVFTQTLELLPHVPVVDEAVEPTCTKPGRTSGTHCERCNEVLNAPVVIPALGHQWSKGVVTGTDPQTGYPIVTFVCQVCQAEKQETGTVVQVDGPTQLVIGESGSFTAEILPASSQNTVYEWSLSQEDQAFATIKVDKKNSAKITLAAGKYLTETHTVTLRVHSADATVDGTYAVQLIPKAVWIDIFSGKEIVTGKQLPVDLNDQGALDITFRAQIYPEDARANLTWSCSDSKGRFCTMTDNQDGTVSVHLLKDASAATVTLTAKDPLSKKTAAVKLSTIRVSTGISIQSPAEGISVYGGTTISLSAVLEGSPKNKAVSWSLPDAYCTYATISGSTLKLLDVSEPTRIQLNASAADGGAEAETWLTILPRVSRLRMTWNGVSASGSYTVYLDHTDDITLKALPFPSASDDEVLWEGLNSEIADFTVDGATLVIHALNKVGKLNITARSKMDKKVSTSITLVIAKHADAIQIFDSKGGTISDANSVTVAGGKTYSFKDSVTTSKDKAITDKTVNWSVDKPEYASIQNGKLRVNPFAGEPVDLIVTACLNADSSITSSVTIRLIPNLASQIRIYWDGTDVAGKTIPASIGVRQLHLQAEAIGCDDEITWSSSNHSVATVDSEGVVSLLKPGNVTITAAQGKKQKATIKLNVVNPITNIQINGQNFVAAGKTLKLDTSINGADVSLPPTQEKLTWLLNPGDEAFASISNGTLKAANISARCTVTVYACVEGRDVCSLPFHVTIAPAATNVLIRSESGSTIDIRDTEQVQLNAQLAPTQASQDVVWSCSGKGVTIDADGILTISPSAKPGSVVVTATAADGSKRKASIRLTLVRKMRSEDLTLPEELSIKGGKIYKIPVTLSNGSESSLVWTVDNTAWATISKGKLRTKKVTGVKYITVTAIAGDGSGVSKTCRIAITP